MKVVGLLTLTFAFALSQGRDYSYVEDAEDDEILREAARRLLKGLTNVSVPTEAVTVETPPPDLRPATTTELPPPPPVQVHADGRLQFALPGKFYLLF